MSQEFVWKMTQQDIVHLFEFSLPLIDDIYRGIDKAAIDERKGIDAVVFVPDEDEGLYQDIHESVSMMSDLIEELDAGIEEYFKHQNTDRLPWKAKKLLENAVPFLEKVDQKYPGIISKTTYLPEYLYQPTSRMEMFEVLGKMSYK